MRAISSSERQACDNLLNSSNIGTVFNKASALPSIAKVHPLFIMTDLRLILRDLNAQMAGAWQKAFYGLDHVEISSGQIFDYEPLKQSEGC